MKTKITINNKEYEVEIKDSDIEKIEKEAEKSEVKLRPAYGEKYWCIDQVGDIFNPPWYDDYNDIHWWNVGNGFFTKEEAEKELAKRKAIQRIKDYIKLNGMEFEPHWTNSYQHKYTLCYDYDTDRFCIEMWYTNQHYSPFGCLSSYSHGEQLIKECESDLKIIWGVKEENNEGK